jgi:hypothetical protein
VVKAHYKPVTPEQRGRELTRELRTLEQEEPGPDRARRLASFVRSAHEHRSLNLAMHAAELCLADDPDDPDLLLHAYVDEQADLEEQLRALQDLRDLAGYVGRDDLDALADERLLTTARTWLADATAVERRHRLRTLTSILGRERVDDLRDELDAG